MFYDKEIELWKKGNASKNSIGQIINEPSIFTKNIFCDVQPYSTEEVKKEYGFDIECTNRMFCDLEDININTNIVKYKGKTYEVKKLIPWDDYMEVFINA